MLDPNSKPKWWLPLMMLLLPGSCYLYAGVMPNVRIDFLITGALLTVAMVALTTWRFLAPETTNSILQRAIFAQGFTLALLLICAGFWLDYLPLSPAPIILCLLMAYALAWIFPYRMPNASQALYREFYYPKTALMRAITVIVLTLGSAAGGLSVILGRQLNRMGGVGSLIFAIFLTTGLIVGGFYLSAQFWRIQRGMNPVPPPDE